MGLKKTFKLIIPSYQKIILDYKVEPKPRNSANGTGNPFLYEIINKNRAAYKEILSGFLSHTSTFHSIKKSGDEKDPNQPCYNNEFLPGLDIVALYGMIARFKPNQYIEIGSGNSTKVARKAITDLTLKTNIISIDPVPRAEIDILANKIIRQPLENLTDFSFADSLNENDILFIDNSHRSFPNSDVTVCFLEILPRLKKGVIIHIHDIYLPYDYPQFMCDRFYNEQYLLGCLLLGGTSNYETILPNFFISEDKELASVLEPIWNHTNLQGVERHGGSYWLVKK
ncbi:MAG: class I SAM-dependent methyltransferase [Flavobacteriales bacterium]